MNKLKLALDELTVETFATAEHTEPEGTVLGNVTPTRHVSCYLTCPFDCTGEYGTQCCTNGTNCCTGFDDSCMDYTCSEATCANICG